MSQALMPQDGVGSGTGRTASQLDWDVRWVTETGSTNADLKQLAQQGHPEGVVLVADYQTQGRGRHGRKWESPPGDNLLFSVLLRPACEVADYHWITQLAALSIREVCLEFTGCEAWLKWPNDVLAQGKKLAGILAEAVLGSQTRPVAAANALVLGIGLNVNWPVSTTQPPHDSQQFMFPPTSLLDLLAGQTQPTDASEKSAGSAEEVISLSPLDRQPLDRQAVLDAILRNLKFGLSQMSQPGWSEQVRAEVKRSSATLGQKIMVELKQKSVVGQAVVAGIAVDISVSGALILKPEAETLGPELAILSGDVVHAKAV